MVNPEDKMYRCKAVKVLITFSVDFLNQMNYDIFNLVKVKRKVHPNEAFKK